MPNDGTAGQPRRRRSASTTESAPRRRGDPQKSPSCTAPRWQKSPCDRPAVAVGEVVAAVTACRWRRWWSLSQLEPPTPEAGCLRCRRRRGARPPVLAGLTDINVDARVQRVAAQQRERVGAQEFEQSAARVSERENGVESHDLKPI